MFGNAATHRASCQSTSIKLGWSKGTLMHSDGIGTLRRERDGAWEMSRNSTGMAKRSEQMLGSEALITWFLRLLGRPEWLKLQKFIFSVLEAANPRARF